MNTTLRNVSRRAAAAMLGLAVLTAACDDPRSPVAPEQALSSSHTRANAQGGGTGGSAARYQLRFIIELGEAQGEITSDLFPAEGVELNTKDPWRSLEVSGAVWSLNNHTHGQWGQGTCTVATDIDVNWDIAGTDPVRTFAGEWTGTVTFWRNRGMNFYLDGTRTQGVGGIHNIASNSNESEESRAPDDSWFRIRLTDARLAFGGASYPDDGGTLADLGAGKGSACANFTVEAVRMP